MALSRQQTAELDFWLNQYTAGAAAADAQMVAAMRIAYADVEDWFDPAQTLVAAAVAAETAQAARQVQTGLMTQFVGSTVEVLTGRPLTSRAPTVPYPRQADPFDVYSRPVYVARDALVRDLAEETARYEAEIRAEMLALTDALLTRRDAALQLFDGEPQVTHYRRVVRPELSATGTCGLCIAAATRVYSVEYLMPIHTRCKCTVLPIVGGADPAVRFNTADLERLYAENPATRRQDLSNTRYRVDRDGELGPLLQPAA